jgi:hypothetical protein
LYELGQALRMNEYFGTLTLKKKKCVFFTCLKDTYNFL